MVVRWSVWQRPIDERDQRPDRGGDQQGRYHPAAEQQQERGGAGEDRVLPGLGERTPEWDRGAQDRADRRRARAVENGAHPLVAAEPVEPASAEQDERERGCEGD